jgi:hypothetical protein
MPSALPAVLCTPESDGTFGLGPTVLFNLTGAAPSAAASSSSYIRSSGAAPYSSPLVPQFLPGGGGDRGRCPIPLPMLPPGAPVPPSPSPAPNATAPPGNGSRPGAGALPANASVSKLVGAASSPWPGRVVEEAGLAGAKRGTAEQCASWQRVTQKQRLPAGEGSCPLKYPRLTWQVRWLAGVGCSSTGSRQARYHLLTRPLVRLGVCGCFACLSS